MCRAGAAAPVSLDTGAGGGCESIISVYIASTFRVIPSQLSIYIYIYIYIASILRVIGYSESLDIKLHVSWQGGAVLAAAGPGIPLPSLPLRRPLMTRNMEALYILIIDSE